MHHTLLAVPLTSTTPPLDEQCAEALRGGAEIIELRVDAMDDLAAVEAFLKAPRACPIILTIRSSAEGGGWDGDDAARIALIERLGLLQPGFIDVELATWERSANLRQKIELVAARERPSARPGAVSTDRERNTLILSHHDFRETPRDLAAVFDRLEAGGAPIIKAAFAARDAADAVRVLEQLHTRAARVSLVALAMGDAGLASRVLARKLGAFLTFAAPRRGAESAPGQPSLDDFRRLYGWDRLDVRTRVFGVVGWPLAHSRSPHVHNAAIAAAGVNGVYLPLPVRPDWEDFSAFMDLVDRSPWLDLDGLSITIPHKEHALRWLHERNSPVSAIVTACGSVNTLTRTPGGWRGDNTDALAVIAALRTCPALALPPTPPHAPEPPTDTQTESAATAPAAALDPLVGRRALVLGAGGAARAAAVALRACGCRITICNRDGERARRLAEALGADRRDWSERDAIEADIIVQCTSVGMWPRVEDSPISARRLHAGCVVLDTVYNPPETRLLREARQAGAHVVSGVEMFLAQAEAQFQLWHARPAPAGAMRAALNPPPGPG